MLLLMNKQTLFKSIVFALISLAILPALLVPQKTNADGEILAKMINSVKVTKTIKMVVTAYFIILIFFSYTGQRF